MIPDTFTDSADVVVDGRLGPDGTFRATTLLAKCASRYENAPESTGTRRATDRRGWFAPKTPELQQVENRPRPWS